MPELETRPARLSLSEILRMMLARSGGDRSGVTLTQNAKGETQIEVTVRTSDDGEVLTADDAAEKARRIYDDLRGVYPHTGAAGDTGAVSLTRNAKGETQITVELKTGEGGPQSLEETVTSAIESYDKARMQYPMADGHSAKPGSVA